MKGMKAAIAATAVFVFSACAAPPPKPVVKENLVQKTATVESIDQASRLVTIRTEDGYATTIKAGDAVKNLPQVRTGDKVIVSYYQSLAAEVKKPGEGVAGVQTEVGAVSAPPGSMPAGGVGTLTRTTVTIEFVDNKSSTVTFKRSDGSMDALVVESPEGKEFIKGLKKGDQVEVAYTEALAVEVKPVN
jgi:hypothetical protein